MRAGSCKISTHNTQQHTTNNKQTRRNNKTNKPHLRAHERGRDVLQLERREAVQLLVDALEDVVVQVPRLVQLGLLAAGPVLGQPLVRLGQLAPVRLHKGDLLERRGALPLHHLVQRQQRREHRLDVGLAKVEARRFFQRLVPGLVPEDGDADELLGHELRLLDERGAVRAQRLEHGKRGGAAARRLALGGDQERVHQRLRVVAADAHEQGVDELAHGGVAGVDARDDLRDDAQPFLV